MTEDEKAKIRALAQTSLTDEVKVEDGSTHAISFVIGDYHIEDRFFLRHRTAFDIFVKFLYNENPVRPKTKTEARTMRQAYGLAIKYKCLALQNRIMDCLRAYYSRAPISFDDLIWASNRLGDHTECALNAYLVEQIAFEISHCGLPEFAKKNDYIWTFLREGNRYIRLELFKAICGYAQQTSSADPAKSGSRFHVHENGPEAGTRKD